MASTGGDATLSLKAIEGLEGRLRALQHHLSPPEDVEDADAPTAYERLQTLSAQIDELASKNRAVSDLLYFYAEHRDLFASSVLPSTFGSPSPSEQLAVVNSCATRFPATLSQLNSMQSLKLPPTDALTALSELKPKLARVELKQSSAAEEVAELRARTAALMQRWHSVSVLAAGGCWAEWEERLLQVERAIAQRERKLKEEKDGV